MQASRRLLVELVDSLLREQEHVIPRRREPTVRQPTWLSISVVVFLELGTVVETSDLTWPSRVRHEVEAPASALCVAVVDVVRPCAYYGTRSILFIVLQSLHSVVLREEDAHRISPDESAIDILLLFFSAFVLHEEPENNRKKLQRLGREAGVVVIASCQYS
jgi:hypothetical protein